jgi:ubiquinone/menaquinone biosynthesis C-methylase UbiE
MAELPEEIIRHYEADWNDEATRITSGLGELELVRTKAILRRFLPPPPARILDVGGATGVHARWLTEDRYGVHVVDPVESHVETVLATLSDVGVTAEVGDARLLSAPDGSYDVALVFGPLYHLNEREDRVRALREAMRVVLPGGLVAIAAISRFASLFDGLARGFLFNPEFRAIAEGDLRNGRHSNPTDNPHWFTTAYFHHPDDLRDEINEAGLVFVELLGVEGLAGWLGHLEERWATPEGRETILFAAQAVESEPTLLGLSAHLLAIARTPL